MESSQLWPYLIRGAGETGTSQGLNKLVAFHHQILYTRKSSIFSSVAFSVTKSHTKFYYEKYT